MTPPPGRISRSGLLLAALLAAIPFLPALGADRTLWYRDVGQNHLPNRALAARMIREGHLPTWNPYRGNGQPFMANPNSLVLRPTTPLFLLFPPGREHIPFTISVLLLAALAGAGTFALLSDAGRSGAAALVGAAAFALSGAFQSLGQLVNLMEGAAWIPLFLFLLDRALRREGARWSALAGLALAMIVSTGEPVLAAVTLMASAVLPGIRHAGWRRILKVAGVAGVVGLLVASAQILPLLELVSLSARAQEMDPGQTMKWSLPPVALLQAVLPALWGDATRAGPEAYWGSGLFETSLPFLTSLHVGLPVILLAGLGWAGGGWGARAAAVAALGGTILSLGRHLPGLASVVALLPGIGQSRYPVKWLLLPSLALAIMAAAGFDRLVAREGEHGNRARRRLASLGALGGFALSGLAILVLRPPAALPPLRWLLGVPERFPDDALRNGALRAIGLSLAAACLASLGLLLLARSRLVPAGGRAAAAALPCIAISLWGAWGLNPAAPPSVVFEPSPLAGAMPADSRAGTRLFGFPRPRGFGYRTPGAAEAAGAGLPQDSLAWGMRWDTRTLRFTAPAMHGIRGAWDQSGESLLGLEPAASTARRLAAGLSPEATLRLLRVASAGWVIGYGDPMEGLREIAGLPGESNIPVRLLAIQGPLPRVLLVDRALGVTSAEEALAAIESGEADPAEVILVEGASPESPPGLPAPHDPPGRAEILEEGPSFVRVRAEAPRACWLLLTDSWAPGWRAVIDGGPADLRRADGAFRAVRVPEGAHEILFDYRPAPVRAGVAASVLGLLLAAVLLVPRPRAKSAP